jgi:hypothetical protein
MSSSGEKTVKSELGEEKDENMSLDNRVEWLRERVSLLFVFHNIPFVTLAGY